MIIKPANRSSLQGSREIGIDPFRKTNLIWALMKHEVNMFMEQKHRSYQQRFSQTPKESEQNICQFLSFMAEIDISHLLKKVKFICAGKVGMSSHFHLHPPAMYFPNKCPA